MLHDSGLDLFLRICGRLGSHFKLGLLDGLELELRLWLNDRLRVAQFDAVLVFLFVDGGNIDRLVGGQHVVAQRPAGTARELGDNDVAVAEELDVKVDVVDGLQMLVLCCAGG